MYADVGLGGGFDEDHNPVEAARDHTVLIVGYGRERGIEYYLCQNNVGKFFMDEGYFKIQRNVGHPHGTASIAKECYYPIIQGHGAQNVSTFTLKLYFMFYFNSLFNSISDQVIRLMLLIILACFQ